MKQAFILLLFILFVSNIWAQTSTVYDIKDRYYSKTNFEIIDTVNYWTFIIDTSYKGDIEDTVKPIGAITFLRKVKLFDKEYFEANKGLWQPSMSYEIFQLKDSLYCVQESKVTRHISSCTPPDVGGDLLVIGNFILLNRRVCLNLRRWDNNIDYARPVVNKILSDVNRSEIRSFNDFNLLLPIKGKVL